MLPRKGLCALVALALFVAPVLAGCGGTEPTAASAIAHSGILGGVLDGLKQEDDEAEVKELRETEPQTREEREDAHEQAEAAAIAAAQEPGSGQTEQISAEG
jgi:hypothetical protein